MSETGSNRFKLEYAVTGAVLGILGCILFFRPVLGVADNGDFARIMNSTGLFYLTGDPAERYFGYVNRLYGAGFIIPLGGGYLSTQLPIILAAVLISRAFLGAALFDIRFLAAIYVLVFSSAVFIAVRCARKRSGIAGAAAAAAAVFFFCDTGYTTYFNSLYGEPVTYVFILLMAAMALMAAYEERPAIWTAVLFGICAVIFAGAKVQNTPAGFLAALLLLRLSRLRRDAVWRRVSVSSAVLVIIVSLLCYSSVSKDIKVCNKFQTVFYGILRGSPDPQRDLTELGLDPSLSVLAGANYFMPEYPIDIKAPEFQEMIYKEVGHTRIAAFYLRHPDRLLQKLGYAAENGFKLNQGFGNYEKYPGTHYKQVASVFDLWSEFKLNCLPDTLLFVAVFFFLAALILIYEYSRAQSKGAHFLAEFMGFIILTGGMQFILPIIGDGDADISKHLFMFNICFDILAAGGFVYLSVKAGAAVRYFRDRRTAVKLQTE